MFELHYSVDLSKLNDDEYRRYIFYYFNGLIIIKMVQQAIVPMEPKYQGNLLC